MRYRLYSFWELSTDEVFRVVVFLTASFRVGVLGVGGLLLVAAPPPLPEGIPLPPGGLRVTGALLLATLALYLAWSADPGREIRIVGLTFPAPGLPLALRQLVVAALDWVVLAPVLYVLLPPALIGADLVAALFLWRAVYFLAPLLLFGAIPPPLRHLLWVEGFLPLTAFQGPRWKDVRQTMSRAQREGVEFAWLEPGETEPHLAELREISDAWLASRNTREKGFSVGSFDERYLLRTPIGIARQEGRILGFANALAPERRDEISADLIRYRPDAMKGVMDFLFAHLFLEGKARGYRWFSLGMAPLSGFDNRPLSPL